jgi:hypothetical protein
VDDHRPQPGQVQAALDETDPAVRMVDADPTWPARFAAEAARIRAALGPLALRLEASSIWTDPDRSRRIARMISPRRGILSRWLNDLGSSGQAAFKFPWILGEVAGDVAE